MSKKTVNETNPSPDAKKEKIAQDASAKHMSEDASEQKKNGWTGRIVIAVIFLVLLGVYFAVPSVHTWVNRVIVMFQTGNFDEMHAFIAPYGKWAMALSFFLMVFQSMVAPLPAFFPSAPHTENQEKSSQKKTCSFHHPFIFYWKIFCKFMRILLTTGRNRDKIPNK